MSETFFLGKKALILGMGVSGRSAAQFLNAYGASVHGVDCNRDLLAAHPEIQILKEKGAVFSSEEESPPLQQFDFIVLSPGLPLSHPIAVAAKGLGLPFYGEIELGCCIAKNRMFGITGTNGKTTVTLLITHILERCGIPAKALGNVGIPFTRELLTIDRETVIILELSSYQIETLYHPCLEAGLILNITADHLDRYPSMEAYAETKCTLERALKPGKHLYIEEKAFERYGGLLTKQSPRLYGYHEKDFIYTDLHSVYRDGEKAFELPEVFRGKKGQDLENLLAAYAFCAELGVEGEVFIQAALSFNKPPHRLEFVAEVKGVRYVDDSKGTNVDAVIRAVESIPSPIILIAGGVDKGSAYTPWINEFEDKVKLICVIGQAAAKIHAQLIAKLPVMIFDTLDEAVGYAARTAQEGDTVLLSPGCSSFDMFKDYIHRGCEFRRIVHELEERVK